MEMELSRLIEISRILKDEFHQFTEQKKPGAGFLQLMEELFSYDDENAVDVIIGVLEKILDKDNISYFEAVFEDNKDAMGRMGFFLAEAMNTALDLMFSVKRFRIAFAVLKVLAPHADARTLDILQKHSAAYYDLNIMKRTIPFRQNLEQSIQHSINRINAMKFESPVSFFGQWQE